MQVTSLRDCSKYMHGDPIRAWHSNWANVRWCRFIRSAVRGAETGLPLLKGIKRLLFAIKYRVNGPNFDGGLPLLPQ